MGLKAIVLASALLLSGGLGKARAAEYFVAVRGSDAQAGTAAEPFATLERARDAARQVHGKTPGEPVTVWLSAGTYVRTETFLLDERDSNTTYAARGGQQPILTGGRALAREWFERTTDAARLKRIIDPKARGKVWQIDLRAHGITDYGENQRRGFGPNELPGRAPLQCYVGGQRLVLARWPNPEQALPQYLLPYVKNRLGVVGRAGKGAVFDPGPTARAADFRQRGGRFKYAFERADHWGKAEEIWLDGIFNYSWEWSYNRVAKIEPATRTITLGSGECNGMADQYSGNFFFAENLLEELDQPGEYWLERQSGVLYLNPPAGFFQPAPEIVVTLLKGPMLVIRGAAHLTFRNLELTYGRDWAVRSRGAEGVVFEHCVVRDFTGGGLELSGKEQAVRACQVLRNGGTSVSLDGGDTLTLERGGNVVEDSAIFDSGWYHRVYHPAIALRGVGQRASHNVISGHPHQAIALKGNEQVVEGNDIGNVCEEFTDMGAVYIYTGAHPTERGQVVRGNFFHDLGHFEMQNAVYPDDGTMGVLIEGNVFARIGGTVNGPRCRSINNNSGAYIITRNNLFIDCAVPYVLSAHSGSQKHGWQKRSWDAFFAVHPLRSLPHFTRYPELQKFWEEERQFPTSNVFERNVVWNPSRPLVNSWPTARNQPPVAIVDGAVAEYPGLQRRENWVAESDPGFVNAAAGDYTLRTDGELFRRVPGFQAIAFREIGPRVRPGVEAAVGRSR